MMLPNYFVWSFWNGKYCILIEKFYLELMVDYISCSDYAAPND